MLKIIAFILGLGLQVQAFAEKYVSLKDIVQNPHHLTFTVSSAKNVNKMIQAYSPFIEAKQKQVPITQQFRIDFLSGDNILFLAYGDLLPFKDMREKHGWKVSREEHLRIGFGYNEYDNSKIEDMDELPKVTQGETLKVKTISYERGVIVFKFEREDIEFLLSNAKGPWPGDEKETTLATLQKTVSAGFDISWNGAESKPRDLEAENQELEERLQKSREEYEAREKARQEQQVKDFFESVDKHSKQAKEKLLELGEEAKKFWEDVFSSNKDKKKQD